MTFEVSLLICGVQERANLGVIQSKMRVRANLSGGTSSASSNRPSGNIQRPKMGRKLSNPPQIRRIAAARRIQADDDCLSHRTAALNRGGDNRHLPGYDARLRSS